jgi:hypothetical protein
LASARIRLPPEHRRTADAARGAAASRSFVKVRNMAGVGAGDAGGRRRRCGAEVEKKEIGGGSGKWVKVPVFIRLEVVGD